MTTIQNLVIVSSRFFGLNLTFGSHRIEEAFTWNWCTVILISLNTSSVSFQASGSEAAHILASCCLGNSSTLRHPAAGRPTGQDPG